MPDRPEDPIDLSDHRQLVGQRFGPGPGIIVDKARVAVFCRAIGASPTSDVPLLLVVSLLPALGSGIELPLPQPRATINYGLNGLERISDVQIGDVLQSSFTISGVRDLGSAVQINRTVEISANGNLAVIAETVARLVL